MEYRCFFWSWWFFGDIRRWANSTQVMGDPWVYFILHWNPWYYIIFFFVLLDKLRKLHMFWAESWVWWKLMTCIMFTMLFLPLLLLFLCFKYQHCNNTMIIMHATSSWIQYSKPVQVTWYKFAIACPYFSHHQYPDPTFPERQHRSPRLGDSWKATYSICQDFIPIDFLSGNRQLPPETLECTFTKCSKCPV